MNRIVLCILIFWSASAAAQHEKRAAIKGNESYLSGDLEKARESYEKALELNEEYYEGGFNLGNTLHRKAEAMANAARESQNPEEQQQLAEASGALNQQAANRFEMLANQADNKTDRAKAYHNMGNAKLKAGDIDGSIESYKQALRNNPEDNETRYNLAFAKLLKQQQEEQQQEQDQDQDQDEDQDKDQDQQNDDQQDQDDQRDQDQQDGDQDQQQPPQKQDQPNQLSYEDAQEMLDALQKEEDDVQNKVKEKQQIIRIEIEQDW